MHDMLKILKRRYPLVKVILLPVRVQGVEAPAEICGAIRYVNKFHLADVIITGRGGGSAEDLWAFNDENLAYEIYQSEIPVISAVGHEPDVTISDYVADLRAATPSNAAELVVPDQMELRERMLSLQNTMQQAMLRRIKHSQQQIDALCGRRVLRDPMNYLQDRRLLLDHRQKDLMSAMQRTVASAREKFVRLTAGLDAMSPLKVLSRGYSLVRTERGILMRSEDVQMNDRITVRLHSGEIDAKVTAIRGGNYGEDKKEL